MLKPTFVNTANGEPLTANRGLKFAVDCENAKLNVPNDLWPVTCKRNLHELFNESPFLNVNKLNSFVCTVYDAYKDFEERLYCFLC